MKIIMKWILLILIGTLITACIEYNIKIKVNTDGSGTVNETVLLSKSLVSMFNEFAALGNESEGKETVDLFNENELIEQAKKMGEGVKFVEGEKIFDRGREGYTALYEFSDVKKLKIDQDPDKKVPADFSTGENNEEQITFNFSKGSQPTLTINLPGDFDPKDYSFDEKETETGEFEEIKEMLKDLRILIQVEVNGEIIETNATYRVGSELTLMQFDMGKILDNTKEFEFLKNQKVNSKQDLRELLDKIHGVKIELENKVKVKFK